MKLDLSRFRGESASLDRHYEPASFPWTGEEFRVVGPADLVTTLRRDGRKFRLSGKLTATLECECSRCAEPYAVPVDADVDLVFLPVTENTGAGDRQVEESDFGVTYYRDDEIDLGEVMREQFYLALPMKPLCREDCRGLCSVCGINRNRQSCTCEAIWTDPRMDPLRKFRDSH